MFPKFENRKKINETIKERCFLEQKIVMAKCHCLKFRKKRTATWAKLCHKNVLFVAKIATFENACMKIVAVRVIQPNWRVPMSSKTFIKLVRILIREKHRTNYNVFYIEF